MTTYDFIVVGAGLAGCIVAARLVEDRECSVLLVEAGPRGRDPLLAMPLAWARHCGNARIEWGFESEPEDQLGGRKVRALRGRVVGGSGTINGMLYARGTPQDYDGWASTGLPAWSYAHVLPYFLRAETDWRGEGPFHGGTGPIRISRANEADDLRSRVLDAAATMGLAKVADFHAPSAEGFGAPDFMIDAGHRASTASAYLNKLSRRGRIRLLTGASVHRITMKDRQATGIEFRNDGIMRSASARREVILAAGAFGSPHLLMLSGIGPADHLRANGIAVVHDLPGVGLNLQDHHATSLSHRLSGAKGFDDRLRLDRLALSALQWAAFRNGPAAHVPMTAMGYFRSRPGLDRTDIQTVVTPLDFDARPWGPGWRAGAGHRIAASVVLLRPASHGRVTLRSGDPFVPPALHFNILADDEDRRRLRDGTRFVHRLMRTEPLASAICDAVGQAPSGTSDCELDAFLSATAQTAMHPTGTCAMGRGPQAVTDDAGLVSGTVGLRVVDASVMPAIVSGNTAAATVMIAEKISDAIRGRSPLPPAA